MKTISIASIGGDGIGPEVIREGKKVIEAAASLEHINIEWVDYDFGAERYLKSGKLITDDELDELSKFKAIYFGALGDPRVPPGILELGIIIKIRTFFDQYINLRPVKLYPGVETPLKNKTPEDINIYFIRENTEDFYSDLGIKIEKKQDSEISFKLKRQKYSISFHIETKSENIDTFSYQLGFLTQFGVERVFKYAFEMAREKNIKKITTADKANVMPFYGLWREIFKKISENYPEIETENLQADALSMWLIKKPEKFSLVVLPNLFGDILTDLGAAIQGGLGIAPGGNINPEGTSMFEPIHGSAPSYKGKNISNPLATILAGSMMLEFLGLKKASKIIENKVSELLLEGKVRTYDLGGKSKTEDVGNELVKKILITEK